jgi:hypothetical protein
MIMSLPLATQWHDHAFAILATQWHDQAIAISDTLARSKGYTQW